MSRLTHRAKREIKELFGERANFDPVELKLYSHDIAALPGLIKPLLGKTMADAVVQPESEEELVELVHLAKKFGFPLIPRGKATSGYGGVLPVKGGVVVDFFRMRKVLEVDPSSLTVRVQAGAVWEFLDEELSRYNLTLRLYPTSYSSSTVGGWLAQGGVGIGSYEAGWFSENVIKARVVLPDGSVREMEGEELDLIRDAEGITGFISEVVLKVKEKENLEFMAIACPDPHDLQHLIEQFIEQDLPLWSLTFINPRMAELKNRAPLREHHGKPVEERVLLPAAYVMSLAFPVEKSEQIKSAVSKIVKGCQAEVLSERIARHEWEKRFEVMVVKRLGPSLIPSEFVVPLEKIGDVLVAIERKVNKPIVKEGVVIKNGRKGPEVAVLGFIPADQRRFTYNFVFSLVLTIDKIARDFGGRPYSTGLYFSHRAEDVLGEGRLAKLREFKREKDPDNLFNPGKVIQSSAASRMIRFAEIFEPLARPIGNYVITWVGERKEKAYKDIPPDIVWYAYACSQCGYCVETCTQFYGRGWESHSPRGKWFWLREYIEGREKWTHEMVDKFLVCTTCELCNVHCPLHLPIEPSWMKMRGKLVQEEGHMTFPPFEMMAAALSSQGNIWAGYRKDRDGWFPEDLKEKHGPNNKAKTVYFAGCTASYVERDIAIATARLLDAAGVDYVYLGQKENCCGTPMLVAGKWEIFKQTMLKNIKAVKAAGADTVITSCPACDMMWRKVYPEWAEKLGIDYKIKAKHYSEVLSEKIEKGEFKFPDRGNGRVRVTFHDSCHIGRVSGVYEPPRELIKAVPTAEFVEMEHNREEGLCCGSVLTLIKEPPVAAKIGSRRLKEAEEAGADKLLALCPCCEFQLRVTADKTNSKVEVQDLARFAAEALGYSLPDPHPEVRAQWAVFEKMIALMTPQGFAELMDRMWPELLKAMPLGMGKMMRIIGKMGPLGDAMFFLMKPLFPILFPILMPKMMPKVLPRMLELVGEMIPMPNYMKEQMPDLMPKVMDNLMPHMLPELVPLVVPKMIRYLKGKAS